MASLVLGAVGAFFGGMVGGPTGAQIGWALGSMIGSIIDPAKGPTVEGPRLTDLKTQTSDYGTVIPVVYGSVRLAGNVMWAMDIKETRHKEKHGGKGMRQTVISYTYSQSFAISICEGKIDGIRRIWMNGELMWSATDDNGNPTTKPFPFTIYLGDEDQMPDPTIQADQGDDTVPYRGVAYVVFTDLDLEKFGNRTPQVEFEVIKAGNPATDVIRVINNDIAAPIPLPNASLSSSVFFVGSSFDTYIGAVGPRFTSFNSSLFRLTAATVSATDGTQTHSGGNWIVDIDTSKAAPDPVPAQLGTRAPGDMYSPFCEVAANFGGFDYSRLCVCNLGNSYVDLFLPKSLGDVATPGLQFSERGKLMWGGSFDGASKYTNGTVDLFELFPDQSRWLRGCFGSSDKSRLMVFSASSGIDPGPLAPNLVDEWHIIQIVSGVPVLTDSGTMDQPRDSFFELGGVGCPVIMGMNFGFATGMIEADGINIWTHRFGDLRRWSIDGGVMTFRASTGFPAAGSSDTFNCLGAYNGIVAAWDFTGIVVPGLGFVQDTCSFFDGTRIAALDQASVPLPEVIADQMTRVGFDPSEFETGTLAGDVVDGLILATRPSARTAIETLTGPFFFDPVESNGKIKFVKRGTAPTNAVPYYNMAATDGGPTTVEEALEVTRLQELSLPKEISLQYLDKDADYRIAVQYARRQLTESVNESAVQVAMVMTADHAKHVVDTVLFNAWIERETFKFKTDRRYITMEPTDVVGISSPNGSVWNVRITKRTEGADGTIEWEAVAQEGSVYIPGPPGSGTPVPPTTGTTPPSSTAVPTFQLVFNSPPLADNLDFSGFYVAVTGYRSDNTWHGSLTQQSTDGGLTFVPLNDTFSDRDEASAMGYARSVLGDWNGDNVLDLQNSVDLEIVGHEGLTSATYLAVLNGANAVWLGGEIIQFQAATVIDATHFRISGLRRGRSGTERFMGTHYNGERWALLLTNDTKFHTDSLGGIGVPSLVRSLTLNEGDTSGVIPDEFENDGTNIRPLSPAQAFQVAQEDGSIQFAWKRRARLHAGWLNNVDVPLDEPAEEYEIELSANAGFTDVRRTISIAGNPGATYSAADRLADFGSTTGAVYGRIFQMSSRVGRGFPAVFKKP